MRAEKLEEAAARLREQILGGEFGPRGILPTRSDLERELGVTHSTLNQVILLLQGEGLIKGNGTRRLTAVPPRARFPWRAMPFAQFVRAQGHEPVAEYLELPERVPAVRELALALGVPEGTLIVTGERRDGTTRAWYLLTRETWRSELIDDEALTGMRAHGEYDAISDLRSRRGVVSRFATEESIGRLADTREQEALGIARTAPVQEITCTYYDHKGGEVLWQWRSVVVAHLLLLRREYEGEAVDALWRAGNP
jgi:DNA-binding GntR family transcriptional regulator